MVDELHFSHAAGDVCCERCHFDAAPLGSVTARSYRPPSAPATPKSSARVQLAERALSALERRGVAFPLVDGTGTLLGRCPACALGTVTLRVIDGDPPRVRSRGCSDGCSAAAVIGAL